VSSEFIFEGVDERQRVVWSGRDGGTRGEYRRGEATMAAKTIPLEGPVTPLRITRFTSDHPQIGTPKG